MKDYQLFHGDCLEIMPTLKAGSVDAIVTDPPWNMGYFDNDNKAWNVYCDWLSRVIKESERLSKFGIFIFQSTKAIPYTAKLFEGWGSFAAVKNFSQMTKTSMPNCWDIAFYKVNSGYRGNGRNYFICNTAGMLSERNGHPTPRSLDVMIYILEMFSWATILDPFMGSGTTGEACIRTGRKFIGIEKDAGYFAIAERRLAQAQPPLFVLDAAQMEAV